jgi:hypothetical protein
VFLNVKRVFELYGDLIHQTSGYTQFERYIAAGFPDPAKDLDKIGLVTNLENLSKSPVGLVFTGSINKVKLLAFAFSNGISFTESAYRGVTLHTSKMDRTSVQLGFVDESTTLVTVDESGVHQGSKDIVDTLTGGLQSYAAANSFALPANWLGNFSLKITSTLRQMAGAAPADFSAIAYLDFITGSVTALERTADAKFDIVGTCDTEEHAAQLEQQLKAQIQASANGGGSVADITSKITVSRSGKSVTMSCVIPRTDMEHWVSK